MYINLFQAFSFGHFQKSEQMCDMAVHTAIRKKSHEMNGRIVVFCIFHSCKKCFILKEVTILDLFCDPCKFLIYNTACAHIHMSNLGVTHLAFRKTYCQSAGVSFDKWILSHQLIHHRSSSLIYCISVMSFI